MTPLLTRIREKVIEANPTKTWDMQGRNTVWVEKVRLADVLLALDDANTRRRYPRFHGMEQKLLNLLGNDQVEWNLREDDLEKQSPECWEFIGEILGV